jgi:hypothetical protein
MVDKTEERKEELRRALGITREEQYLQDTDQKVRKKLKLTKPKITRWTWVLIVAFVLFLIFQFGIRGLIG